MEIVRRSNRGWYAGRPGIALTALATTAVILRFVARRRKKFKLGLDDWLALAALICLFALLIEELLWITLAGMGEPIQNLKPDQIPLFIKLFLSAQMTYSLLSPLVKISVLQFYRRIFLPSTTNHTFSHITAILMFVCIIWGMVAFLCATLQCIPLRAFWDARIKGHCFDALKYFLGIQVVNVVLDLAILVLPLRFVWELRRPWREKAVVASLFLLGAFVVFASIYRLISIEYLKRDDIPYTIPLLAIWTFVEPCIGLVCGSLPIIRGLFPAYRTKVSPLRMRELSISDAPYSPFSGAPYFLTSIGHDATDWDQNEEEGMPGRIRVKTVIEIV